MNGKEYRLAVRIAGVIDRSFSTSLATAGSRLTRTVSAVNRDFTMLDKGFNAIVGAGSKVFHAVATAATVAATAIGAATVAAVKVGSEFEKQMSAVQAISGASAEELAKLSDKARELGRTSVFSATEVGKAMEYMGMAGWKTEQMLAGIEGVLNLAAASGEDLATVSDIVTDVLTAFHMEADETARMVNVMAQAAMNSNTNVTMMGETFKYAGTVAGAMGYQIEDMAIATGLMASSGIKASIAGTALRNIITRMAKPTKESAEAMEALGLSLEKDDGSMYSFLEIMEQMRKGMARMTKVQKAYYAAELGGQRGMPGLLAIADSTDRQFEELTEAIYNAEGAAQRMADIRLDNLAGDVQLFKDSLADAGIELSQELNGQLRGFVQMGTGIVSSAATQIPKVVNRISAEFPTLQRKFKKYAQPVFSGIMDAGKWVVKHGNGIISVLAGIGAALVAYKGASTIVHILNAVMSLGGLNPVTLKILGVVGAIGLLTGAFAAFKQREQELVNQNLAGHFGSISLSMEDLQRVAEHIVGSKSLEGVKEALTAFEDLDGISATMQDAVSEIDKLNWKISIGMGLTDDENESYKQAVESYIKSAQEYARQSQYAVSLNLQAAFPENGLEGHGVAEKVNQFYQDQYDELAALGTRLNEAVTDAFNDGLLDIRETEVIADIQRKMAEIEESLATGEFDARLSALGMEYAAGSGLTYDSFQNLQDEIESQVAAASDTYRESYVKNFAAIQAAYKAGDYLSEADYLQAVRDLQDGYTGKVAALEQNAAGFLLETVQGAYADEIGTGMENLMSSIRGSLESWQQDGNWWNQNTSAEDWANDIYNTYNNALSAAGLDAATQGALKQLYDNMSTVREEMSRQAEECKKAGKEIPEAVSKSLDDINALGALTGDKDAIYTLIGQELGENEEYATLIELAQSQGAKIPEALTVAMREASPQAAEEAQAIIKSVQAQFENGLDFTIPVTYDVVSRHFDALKGIPGHADGGIVTSPQLSWLAEGGKAESVIPLDGSRNALSLWEKTGKLLGMGDTIGNLDLGTGKEEVTVTYSPVLHFHGGAPNQDDLTEALDISQEKFDSLMDRYLKSRSRVSFG